MATIKIAEIMDYGDNTIRKKNIDFIEKIYYEDKQQPFMILDFKNASRITRTAAIKLKELMEKNKDYMKIINCSENIMKTLNSLTGRRGKLRLPDTIARRRTMYFRVNDAERKLILETAEKHGMQLTAFLRKIIFEYIDKGGGKHDNN